MKSLVVTVAIGGALSLAGAAQVQSGALERPPEAGARHSAAPSECQDEDHDGYGRGCAAGPDCNESDPAVHPGQPEICNYRDDDCSGLVDDSPKCAAPAPRAERVEVPSSWLLMGSPETVGAADERPLHRVRVSAFDIDRYEVTNQRYAACVRAGACESPTLKSSALRAQYFGAPAFANYPVVFVGWDQADRFCRWDGGRLPTEAEWELAARGAAPSQRVFPWGDEPADCAHANMGGDRRCLGDTDLVGRRVLGASPWGVMDMAGNVWEWTMDWYGAKYYADSPERDPRGPGAGTLKVMRGGCWASGADSLRVSCRKAELPATWAPNVGFRCVRPHGR